MHPDVSTFLTTLHGGKPDALYCYTWVLPSKRSAWFQSVDAAAAGIGADAENPATTACYTGVAWSATDNGAGKRIQSATAAGIPGLWADVDVAGDGHKKPNLPPSLDDARQWLESVAPTPTLLVHSGHGLQAWWLFPEPWLFTDEREWERATRLAQGWNDYLRRRAKERDWDLDATHDLARVMRIPGTWNRKPDCAPVLATLLHEDTRARYGRGLFIEAMADTGDAPTTQLSVLRGGKNDTDLEIRPDHGPPHAKWETLCEVEPKARASFRRKRKDFQDQSASSYDLSLAAYAVAAGWTDQEVCDLMVYARVKNGDAVKRADYFARTIEKARANLATREAVSRAYSDNGTPSSAAEKQSALSAALGVPSIRVLMYPEDPARYTLVIGEKRIGIGAIANLMAQPRVRGAIADALQMLPPKLKGAEWEQVCGLMLKCREEQPLNGGDTEEGRAKEWIYSYLTTHTIVNDYEVAMLDASPFQKDGYTYVFGAELRRHLSITREDKVGAKEMGDALRAIGCLPETMWLKDGGSGKPTTRYVWRLP